ncbi:hypothetical protein GDO81_022587 [Engystomops pustulosus]|uniref:G-protein coupled receptors family 1 profile domain-containing protein n=1 Tax=Engystomops pustulosus TaxID=76066 RepID=A0AAV6ZNM5_ENGPU|nr:hypothetical protein GDO81_022587 [Engystomops pustulosus]
MEDDLDAFLNSSFIPGFLSENFTFLLNSSFDFDFDFPIVRSLAVIPFLLVGVVGLISNALVLFIIMCSKKMWRTMNVFIFCLALGDFLYMLCLLFLAVEILYPLGSFMCVLYWTLTAVVTFSSVYFLAIMSSRVFLQAYFPDFSKNIKVKVAALTSGGIWILSLLLGIPFFIYANVNEYSSCVLLWPYEYWTMVFNIYRFVLAFMVPLILTVVCLVLTQCRARKFDQSIDPTVSDIKQNVVMIMVLSLIFIIFWLPSHLLELIAGGSLILDSEATYYGISIIPYLKSCIYPFVYGFLSGDFKNAYNRIFCCKKIPEDEDLQKNSNNKSEDKSSAC